MPRDIEGIILQKFALNGDSQAPESLAPPRNFNYADGFPGSYSGPGGNKVPRVTINYLHRVATAAIVDLNKMGVLQWSALIDYTNGASVVMSANGLLCVAVADSGPATAPQNPDSDTNEDFWFRFAGGATETRAGIVRAATDAESDAGSDVNAYMTPVQVKSRIDTVNNAIGQLKLSYAMTFHSAVFSTYSASVTHNAPAGFTFSSLEVVSNGSSAGAMIGVATINAAGTQVSVNAGNISANLTVYRLVWVKIT